MTRSGAGPPRSARPPVPLLGRALACGGIGGALAGGGLTASGLNSPTWSGLFPLGLVLGSVIGAAIALFVAVCWLLLPRRCPRSGPRSALLAALLALAGAVLAALILGGPEVLRPSPWWLVLLYPAAVAAVTSRYITTSGRSVQHSR